MVAEYFEKTPDCDVDPHCACRKGLIQTAELAEGPQTGKSRIRQLCSIGNLSIVSEEELNSYHQK